MPKQYTCPICGQTFFRFPSRRQTFCSLACAYKARPHSPVPPAAICADGLTALIPLQGASAAHALIDATDADWLSQWRWYMDKDGYAVRDGNKRMHREILGLTTGDTRVGDHINRNTLDNRRENLRAIPRSVSSQNMGSHSGSSSSYRGVTWDRAKGRWQAQVYVNGKYRFLGRFDTEQEAAEVARAARTDLMPYAVD